MPAQKTQIVQKLRQRHFLKILFSIAQLLPAIFYYHLRGWNAQTEMKLPGQRSQPSTMRTKVDTITAGSQQNCTTAAYPL
ncbi:hypothetical protein CLOSTMETH_00041 [[Clostridium] methylpentosum DSM 5476]|uniref:Uncharacterized protein n=1 Tax=[Clostridium] methylpentosum DSM 5476 TaxID=537013 RepID=C0E869_9FIRM|nr:hypothetical protein CLOSTMETH_00041 [[Clostridium] methylpentosum DSM 5476]